MRAAGIISKGTDVTPSNTTQTWLGVVFWICIAIGILIVVVGDCGGNQKTSKEEPVKDMSETYDAKKGKRILR